MYFVSDSSCHPKEFEKHSITFGFLAIILPENYLKTTSYFSNLVLIKNFKSISNLFTWLYLFIYLFDFASQSQFFPLSCLPRTFLPTFSPHPSIPPPPIFLQKRAGLLWISASHGISKFNETRHSLSY